MCAIEEKAKAFDLLVKNNIKLSTVLYTNSYADFIYYNISNKPQISEEEFLLLKKCILDIKNNI